MTKKLGPDDIGTLALKLHDFLLSMGCYLDEDQDFQDLSDFLSEDLLIEYMDPRADRNYN